jgi:hydrogenase-4 component B
MPAPGDIAAARLTIRLRDLAWEMLYAPVPTAIWFATEKLNHLQFLSIRQYLSLVFVALVALLLGVSIWP